ncbi:hypothetical protein [Paraburkholderia acidipaludis]|uniref:hypothetical protein n=1 Tax=Paraburkholderia acidipaludis TaxID=660537 RepID=UPI001FDFF4C0|nr:hypothetical protein [Paraburkholderia acidipaludis]
MIQSNNGVLSENRRKQYVHVPTQILDRIEQIVREAFKQADIDAGDAEPASGSTK